MQYKHDESWEFFFIPGACNSETFTDALVYVLYHPDHRQPEAHVWRKLTIFSPWYIKRV